MITHERLKELIEQKAKIFYFDAYEDNDWGIVEVDTKNFSFSHNENCYINFCEETYKTNPQPYKMWEDALFETKEEAEWHKEFGCIERTERLELPTWEDLQNKTEHYINFTTKRWTKCWLAIDMSYRNDFGKILITYADADKNYHIVYDKRLTKENYTIACRKAKELFLGEVE